MTLASSGYISLGGTDATRSANLAAGQASTATITMPSSVTRTLTGVASGPIVLPNDYWGKPAGFSSVSLATIPSNSFAFYTSSTYIEIYLFLNPDGTWSVQDDSGEQSSGNWGSPTTSGGGSAYWVKFTRTGVTPVGSGNSTPTTGWLNLGSARFVQDNVSFFDVQTQSAQYTIQIATDSGGSNVIATRTGVQITAVPGTPP